MKQVFHLKIEIGEIKTDLYFEDQDTAERVINFIDQSLSKKENNKMKVEATVHEVLSKETAFQQIVQGIKMAESDKENN